MTESSEAKLSKLNADIKLLRENLRKATNRLAAITEAEPHIKEALISLSDLKKTADASVSLEPMRDPIREQEIISCYSSLDSKIKEINSLLQEFSLTSEDNLAFLSWFKEKQDYKFDSEQSALAFVENVCKLYDCDTLLFRPEFLGTVDIKRISHETNLLIKANIYLSAPPEALPALVARLAGENLAKNYFLEIGDIKFHFKNSRELHIDAPTAKQRRIGRLFKEQQQDLP